MVLATRCPYCHTTFRVVEDQLKLCNGIVRCGSCQQIFNGSEQLLKPEDIDPALGPGPAVDEDRQRHAQSSMVAHDDAFAGAEATADVLASSASTDDEFIAESESISDQEVLDAPVLEKGFADGGEAEPKADEDLDLILTPDSNFENRDEDALVEERAGLEERDFLAWQSFELKAVEETSIDLDLGEDVIEDMSEQSEQLSEPESESAALSSEIEAEHEGAAYEVSLSSSVMQSGEYDEEAALASQPVMATAVEPDFMKRVRRQQQFGSVWRNVMLVGLLILPLLLLLQMGGAFHNRIVNTFPSAKPLLAKVCHILDCRTELPRQIEKIAVEHSELLALDKNTNRYVLNLLLTNRSGVAQAWPNLELTLNDEAGQPVARRVFMPVDYLSNVNEKTQGVKAQEEKLVRLVFELDKLSAAGYLVHVFYI